MKCLLILLFWSILTNYVTAQNCLPEGVQNPHINTAIDDDHKDEIVRLTVPGITGFSVISSNENIDVTGPFNEEIVFSVSEAFKQFEDVSGISTTNDLSVTVQLICGGSANSFIFIQPVNDVNNNDPVFSESEYRYVLPMPFPPGLDVTQLGEQITAMDKDFRNSGMDFSIDGDMFTASSAGTTDTLAKNHKALIVPQQPLEFTGTREFTITATDKGEPPRSSTAKIIIEVDSVNSVPSTPVFIEPYTRAAYDDLATSDILLEITNADESSVCTLDGDIKENFLCRIDNDQVIVSLQLQLPEDDVELGGYRILTVTVTKSTTRIARTVVILDIPAPDITTTACPTETTETTTVCECPSTTEIVPCPTTEQITTTVCPEITTMSCEPCDTTVACTTLEDTTPCICPDTTTVTACEPCTTTPSLEVTTCEPCDCTESSTTTESCITSLSTELTCPEPTPCVCSTEDTTTDCPSTTPLECPITECTTTISDCPTTPFECPVTECTTTTSDCPTTPLECPVTECTITTSECLDTTPCVCEDCTTISSGTTPCDCSETTSTSVSPSGTGNPETTESSTSMTGSCDCSLCPTTPTDCPVTPQDCSECSTVTATTLDCSYCSAEICEEYVPCEECPTSPIPTTTDPIASVSFSRDSYEFILAYNEVMSEIEWPVSAGSTIEEAITYDANDLPDQLDLDPARGIVTNNNFLPAGIHQFTITAIGERSGASAAASVTVTVQPFEICSDGVRTTYSLLVKEVIENHANTLLTTALDDEEGESSYQLTIESVSPNTDLFYVSEDGQTISYSALDRESDDFAELGATQYTVVVMVTELEAEVTTAEEYRNNVLQISSELSTEKKGPTRADASQCMLIGDIQNDAKRTTIVVVVGDENDNQPEFATTGMVVGYPTSSLLSLIAPAYLVQVEATDADIGINAKLVYIVDGFYVTIHPETGIVYPTQNIPDDDFTFTVTARDEQGEGQVSSNSLQVQVKRLQQEHISIIKLRSVLLEDLSTKIVELNEVTRVSIRQLQASVLPTEDVRQLRADESVYLYITAYALDGSNNLVTTEQLQELLDDVEGLSVAPLEVKDPTGDPSDSDNTGLIAAVSVLSVILFLVLLGFLAFYFLKLRKRKPYTTMEDQISNSSTPTQFEKNMAMGRSSSKLSQLGREAEKPERRPTGILVSSTLDDSDDSPPESPPKERRKSVVFNNNVEQINIVREEDNVENSKL